MVSSLDFESSDPSSNLGKTSSLMKIEFILIVLIVSLRVEECNCYWSYGVMVSTLDSESSDPSSNLDKTSSLMKIEFISIVLIDEFQSGRTQLKLVLWCNG